MSIESWPCRKCASSKSAPPHLVKFCNYIRNETCQIQRNDKNNRWTWWSATKRYQPKNHKRNVESELLDLKHIPSHRNAPRPCSHERYSAYNHFEQSRSSDTWYELISKLLECNSIELKTQIQLAAKKTSTIKTGNPKYSMQSASSACYRECIFFLYTQESNRIAK